MVRYPALKRRSRIFAVSAGASALLFISFAICTDCDAKVPLSWRGVAWELAFKDGRLRVENQPQLKLQADRYAAAVAKVEKESAEQEESSRAGLKKEPWGSPKYRQALKEFDGLRDLRDARISQIAIDQAPSNASPKEYSLSLMQILIALTILPLAWLAARVVPWLRKPAPPVRSNKRRHRLLRAAAAVSSVLFVVVGILWVRGRFIEDRLVYNTRSAATLTTRSDSIWSVAGDIYLVRSEHLYTRQLDFDYEDPANTANGLAKNSWVPTAPGFGYGKIEVGHISHSLSGLFRFRFMANASSTSVVTPLFVYDRMTIIAPGGRSTANLRFTRLFVSNWLLMMLLSIAPLLWARRRHWTMKTSAFNLCPACGYDLRASADRCPECGRAITAESVASSESIS
jgi:hypothetical protein